MTDLSLPLRPPNDPSLIATLTDFRQRLHRRPDLSGHEAATAAVITGWLRSCAPDQLVTGLGGHGVAAVFDSGRPGPTLMFRCELDGLPIEERGDLPYRSEIAGQGHLCGHDGHMAIVAGLAAQLSETRPSSGRVLLLFQPAEENGAGAAAVLADPRFAGLRPDVSFALHNFPGLPLGQARLAAGPMNCASRGMRVTLTGRTAHASMPDTGLSPMPALAALMPGLTALSRETNDIASPDFRMVTVTHASLGEPAFGIAPGAAEIWATLRSRDDSGMAELIEAAEGLVGDSLRASGLSSEIGYHDVFLACDNHPDATAALRAALDAESIPWDDRDLPMRASEDFGRFAAVSRSAMLLLGAGEGRPALHNPDYDFPDALIPVGLRLFQRVIGQMLG